MSIYEALSTLLGVATLLAVVRSLVAVQKQLRIMSEQNEQLRQTITMSAEVALDSLFSVATQAYLDHPELRAVFYPEKYKPRRLGRETFLRAHALAELLCDAMERALMREFNLSETAAGLRAWIADSMSRSAFLREWLIAHDRWYNAELVEIARRAGTSA